MHFSKLPKDLQDAVLALTTDEDFHHQLNNDKILDELEDQEIDKEFDKICADVLLGKNIEMFGHTFKPLNAIAVHKLWLHSNPIITGDEIETKHIDEFLKLLEYPESEEDASGYTIANYSDIIDNINEVIELQMKVAFFPLTFFPVPQVKGGDMPMFDHDWLSRLATIACKVGGYNFDDAIKLPMIKLASLFVQYARLQGTKNIERQSPEEVLRQEDFRYCELVVNRLIELGKIDESEREKYVDLIHTKPENK